VIRSRFFYPLVMILASSCSVLDQSLLKKSLYSDDQRSIRKDTLSLSLSRDLVKLQNQDRFSLDQVSQSQREDDWDNSSEKAEEEIAEEQFEKNPNDFTFKGKELSYKEGLQGVFDQSPEQERLVRFWIHYFTKRGRQRFNDHLKNAAKYRPLVEQILAQYDLPSDLFYVALIESGYNLKIKSKAKAVGPWQFIAGTGKRYGLKVNQYVDERRHIIKSTHAAAKYLKELYRIFQDWPLALASYNSGENRVLRAVDKAKAKHFATLSALKLLPRETRYYVPKLVAAKIVMENLESFGFAPLDLDKKDYYPAMVMIPLTETTSFHRLEKVLGIQSGQLQEWNSDIKGHIIEASTGRPYLLTLVSGSRNESDWKSLLLTSRQELVLSRQERRKVEGGRQRISLSRYLTSNRKTVKGQKTYVVRKGDSLAKIAVKFNMPVRELMELNALESKKIFPKQRIQIKI
jgi:membrane-bound lytic murein transglycosylase D